MKVRVARLDEMTGATDRKFHHKSERGLWQKLESTVGFTLYTPDVPFVILERFFDLDISDYLMQRVGWAVRLLSDGGYHAAHVKRDRWAWTPESIPMSPMKKEFVQQMWDRRLLRPVRPQDIRGWALLSSLPQIQKLRERTILDCLFSNAQLPPGMSLELLGIRELKMKMATFKYASSIDAKSCYQALPFHESAAVFNAVRTVLGFFVPTFGPMGHINMCATADAFTQAIGAAAIRAVCSEFGVPESAVFGDYIIDNSAFASNDLELLTAVHKKAIEIAEHIGFTIGDVSEPGTVLEHRGMVFDLTKQTVSLKATFIEKVTGRLQMLLDDETVTSRHWESVGGNLGWARTVIEDGALRVDDFHLWRYVAHVNHASKACRVAPPATVRRAVKGWISLLQSSPSAELKKAWHRPQAIFVSDACKHGVFASWGAVYVAPSGALSFASGVFDIAVVAVSSINVLECETVGLGIRALNVFDVDLAIANDNVSTLFSLIRQGVSKSWPLHCAARSVLQTLSAHRLSPVYFYVNSAANCIDGVSRQREFTQKDLELLQALAGWVGWRAEARQGLPTPVEERNINNEKWN